LWDPEKCKVIISQDVVFDETDILKAEYTPPNDSETEWEVEAILDESIIDGTPRYKVKWTGYDECTWELLEHVEHLDTFTEWIHSKTEKVMIATTTSSVEPSRYTEVMNSLDADKWIEAMASELNSLAKN